MPRPTLLVGLGRFGLDAMHRLLHQSALRGVLRWEETQSGGVASAERRLLDLALVALPDPFEPAMAGGGAAAVGVPQFLADLYRQVRRPPAADAMGPAAAADWVRGLADALVAQTAFDPREPLGLDLIWLARPGAADAVPHLDTLIEHCLESLADSRFFKVAVQGAANLSSLLILDFDDYWCGTGDPAAVAAARDLRAALANSMATWERRRTGHQVALERCYLIDGRTAAGYRPPPVRLDEAVLFLELLLFEGLRTHRQGLFQQQSLAQPVAATFGVRLLEEGALVRSREAAATFGRHWLEALHGERVERPDREPRRLREVLEPVRREALRQALADAGLERLAAAGAERLLETLTAVPDPESADWPTRVQACFAQDGRALEEGLEAAGRGVQGRFRDMQLKDLDARLSAAVDADLHDERAPVPLAQVRALLTQVRDGLAGAEAVPSDGDRGDDPFARLVGLHARYRAQVDEWLARQGRALHRFWPLFALLLALGLAMPTVRLVWSLDPPGRDWLDAAVEWLRAFNRPFGWTLVWFFILWAVLALRVQPAVTARIARAQRFFLSRERGRFRDHLRELVDPLRTALPQRVRRNLDASLANEVRESLERVGERLERRAREIAWLHRQLGEFLRLSAQPPMAVRQWVRRDLPLETMLRPRPLERVWAPQDDLPRPFAGWQDPYCDAFLDPLRFIDRLSRLYADADEEAELRRSATEDWPERRRAFVDFIETARLAPACRFLHDNGVPQARAWCITGPRWRGLPGLAEELNHRLGIVADDLIPGRDRARLYLLTVQSGIGAENLEREEG